MIEAIYPLAECFCCGPSRSPLLPSSTIAEEEQQAQRRHPHTVHKFNRTHLTCAPISYGALERGTHTALPIKLRAEDRWELKREQTFKDYRWLLKSQKDAFI